MSEMGFLSRVPFHQALKTPVGNSGGGFNSVLSEFVYTRTYARWNYDLERREMWPETVGRYVDFVASERKLPSYVVDMIRSAILKMDVLPSMRALWAAGEAMAHDNVCAYNCAFVPLDSLPSFAEMLYILMMGTGVGFSVERRFVNNLPVVGEVTGETVPYVIPDSTTGWADGFLFGLNNWFRGNAVEYDFSLVRPEGAPLRRKGGRASGPAPLQRLLEFAQKTVLAASGRKLRSVEAHDIGCMVGEIVMAGGVRRAALISFSDPDDEEMRHAKDWSRGEFPTLRYMANNSAYWDRKPEEAEFTREWTALRNSGSGERGFFRMPPHKRATRRSDYRTNPCVTADTWVHTTEGPRQVGDLIGRQFEAVVDGRAYTSTDAGFWSTGRKPVFRLETAEGYNLELTGNHQVCRVQQSRKVQKDEWVQAADLKPGDLIRLNNHRDVVVERDDAAGGWLIGSLIGDGTFTQNEHKSDSAHLRFWGEDGETMANFAFDRIKAGGFKVRSDMRPCYNKANKFWQISSVDLSDFAASYEVVPTAKTITPLMERESDGFAADLLSGLFDADGSVQGNQGKGVSVRLAQSTLSTLEAAQRMLLRLGIVSTIYQNRREAGYRDMPDGKGGLAPYWCEAQHELVIANDNLFRFEEVVGFNEPAKRAALEDLLGQYRRAPNRERFVARVKTLVPLDAEDVFDCTIPGLAAFDANGLYVHNCGEIGLRYSLSVDPWTGEGGGGQFCNLSAAVMRADDTRETMAAKVQIATWIGAVQSTFTHFPYLRPAWKQHCDEDRLLGVDITGQCDAPHLSTDPEVMSYLNRVARETAAEATAYLGVNYPAAITCGKPSGNSSQLVDCASGFHARFAPFYIRRVRIAQSDPLFRLIKEVGVPLHKDNQFADWKDEDCPTWVAEFPVKAPAGAVFRDAETAIQMLERYRMIMQTWCGERGHNQSVTVYVKDNEWDEVGAWVFEHFDEVTGVSFLPFDGGKYRLAPYEEIDEATYNRWMETFPTTVDFSRLTEYEREDRGEGATELACSGGSCTIDYEKIAMEMGLVLDPEIKAP